MSTFRERNQKRKETAKTGGMVTPSASSQKSTFSDRFQERKNKMRQETKAKTNFPNLSESILSQDKYKPMTSGAAAQKVVATTKAPLLPHVDKDIPEETVSGIHRGAASRGIGSAMLEDENREKLEKIEQEKAKYINELAPLEKKSIVEKVVATADSSSLPADIENKYGHKYNANTVPVNEYIEAVKSGKVKGSRVTDSILNSEFMPDKETSLGARLDYMLNAGLDKYNAAHMTKKERDLYFQIMMSEGVEVADLYYEELEPHLKKRRSGVYEGVVKDVTTEASSIEKTILTGGEIASTLLSPLNYPITVYETLSGNDLGANNLGLDTATETIAGDIAKDSEIGSWIYQLSLSAGKSAMTMLATGGNPAATQFMMGADAASSAVKEGQKRGLSPEQSVAYGTAVGIIEGVTEKIGIDAFFGSAKNALFRILKNAAAEGSEEVLSEILSNFADVLINQDQSKITVSYERYISEGHSDEEAKKLVLKDLAAEVALSFLGGSLIGGGFGAAGTVINNANQNANDIELGNAFVGRDGAQEDIKTLIDEANKTQDKKLKRAAQRVDKSKYDFGELGTNYVAPARDLGKLARLSEEQRVRAMVTAASADGIKSQTIAKLTESGLNNREAERVFELIVRDASKAQVSSELGDLMRGNKTIRPIYEEITKYMSDEEVLRRVAEAEKASPITKVTENIAKEQLKKEGVPLTNDSESGKEDIDEKFDNPVSVEGINEYGNLLLKTESGATVEYKDSDTPSFDISAHAKLQIARFYGANGASAYFKLAPDRYNKNFAEYFGKIYRQGTLGRNFEAISYSGMSLEVQKAIYDAGKADLENAAAKSRREVEKAKKKEAAFIKEEMGFKNNRVTISAAALEKMNSIKDDGVRKQYQASAAVIDALAMMLQVDINIVASDTDSEGDYISSNGSYNSATNSFTLDITAGLKNVSDVAYTAMVKTAGHELTHYVQNWSPSKYIALRDNTVRFLQKLRGESWVDKQIENIVNNNSIAGKELTRNQAIDELVADSFEEVLTEIDFAETLLRADETLFGKVRRWIKDHIANFKKNLYAAVGDRGPKTKAGAEMRLAGKKARALFEEWSDAFVTAYENSTSQKSAESETKEQLRARKETQYENVVVLTSNKELLSRIEQSNKSKYSVIKDFLIEKFQGQQFVLSDGIKAIMDNRDAQELSHKANNSKTALLGNLRDVIENARFFSKADNVVHKKFNAFRYYSVQVLFENEKMDFLINVGKSKYDNKYHIYDITKNRRIANQSSTGLSRHVGYAIKNDSSIKIIPQESESVNTENEQYQARNTSDTLDIETRRSLADAIEESVAQADDKIKTKTAASIRIYRELIDSYASALDVLNIVERLKRENSASATKDELEQLDASIVVAKYTVALHENSLKKFERGKAFFEVYEVFKNDARFETLFAKKAPAGKYTQASLKEAATQLLLSSEASGTQSELIPLLQKVYDVISGSENLSWEDVSEAASPVADWLIEHRKNQFYVDDTAEEIKRFVRNQRIYLTEEQKAEVAYVYDGYNNFRKKAFGKIILSNEAAQPLGVLWQELAGKYPQYFDSETKDAEMPQKLLDVLDSMKQKTILENAIEDKVAYKEQLIREIYESYDLVKTRTKPLDYGKYEGLMTESKAMITHLREQLSDAERSARDAVTKAERAEFRMKQNSLRVRRDQQQGELGKLRTRIKQAIEKPTERASIPQNGEKVAESLLNVSGTLSELLRTRGLSKSEDELITLVNNIAVAKINGTQTHNGTDPAAVERIIRASDSLQTQLGKELNLLKEAYEAIAGKQTADFAYDEKLSDWLSEYIADNTKMYGGGEEMLQHISEGIKLIRSISHRLMSANRAMVAGRWVDLIDLRDGLREDTKNAPKSTYKILTKVQALLNPKVMIHLAFGVTKNSNTLYDMYNDGQTKFMRYIVGAKDIFAKLEKETAKSNLLSKEATIATGLKDNKGNDVYFNPDLAISFLLAMENEDYVRHIIHGGMKLPDLKKLYSSKSEDAYVENITTEHLSSEGKIELQTYLGEYATSEDIAAALDRIEKEKELTSEDLIIWHAKREFEATGRYKSELEMRKKYEAAVKKISAQLDPLAVEWLNAIRTYYNTYAKELLDEATMERYGFTKTIKNRYYPIRVAKDQKHNQDSDLMKYDHSLESIGSMKNRLKSELGVELFGAISSLDNQIETTATYYGWINAIDLINKTLRAHIQDGTEVTTLESFVSKQSGDEKFKKYAANLEADISGRTISTNDYERLLSLIQSGFVASALSFNISTMVKQFSAYPLIAAETGYKNVVKGFGKGLRDDGKPVITEAQQRMVAKYSLVYKYRAGGLINIDLAALKNTNNPLSKFMQKHPALTGTAWPEWMDAQTLGCQFFALREVVKKQHASWSEEQINTETGKQLDKAIQDYQANYTVLQRSPLLRGKASVTKLALGTFRSQQLTLLNANIDAVLEVVSLSNQIKREGKSDALSRSLNEAKKKAMKVSVATAVSYVFNALLAMGINFMFRREDEGDELLKDGMWDLAESYLSMLPGMGDVFIYLIKKHTGQSFYGEDVFSIGALETLQDFIDVFGKIGEGELTVDRVVKDFAKLVAPLGIPLRNAYNLVKALLGWFGIEIE